MYAIQALVMNSWSWNGFANALLMGAVTGGVSGGLGQVFSASGFWGSVGSSAFVGAGTGGVTALINGQNFLEGVLKGAVIGGGVAAVSYSFSNLFTASEAGRNYADANGNTAAASNDVRGDKLNWFNKEKDGYLYKAAELDTSVPERGIRIYTHGAPNLIIGPDHIPITTPEQFDKILMQRSEVWRNFREHGGSIRVELMSCQTGRWSNGIASKFSKAFRNAEFIAPSTKFFAGEMANGRIYTDIAGRFKFFNPGRWNHFVDGQNITGLLDKYKYIPNNILWNQKTKAPVCIGGGCQ
ncbi:hypothetical protein OWR28_20815 [Chryseobacterium sp. 1B4]